MSRCPSGWRSGSGSWATSRAGCSSRRSRRRRSRARARLQLLIGQAERGNCDLVARVGALRFTYAGGAFVGTDGVRLSLARLEQRALGLGPLTFTAVPPGEG